jgi:hypothetical protein
MRAKSLRMCWSERYHDSVRLTAATRFGQKSIELGRVLTLIVDVAFQTREGAM